ALPEWLDIGNTDENAACNPLGARLSISIPACKNCRYESSCVARRNGISSTGGCSAKFLRMRFFSVNEEAMTLNLRVGLTVKSKLYGGLWWSKAIPSSLRRHDRTRHSIATPGRQATGEAA